MKQINWLHFTDLHTGLKDQEWLWPTFQKQLFLDLNRLYDSGRGPWDIVLFSGDLTQAGTKSQFDKISKIIETIWKTLSGFGSTPLFVPIPGNHDLKRPKPTSAVVRALKNWHGDKEIRELFWESEHNEYRQTIEKSFENYSSWLKNLSVPKPDHTKQGILPGDFSTVIEKSGIRLGLVGLNTAFLQITNGNYGRQLELHPKQLFAVCDQDPDSWVEKVDISLLMTHHGADWLHDNVSERYLSEIYPPGRFFSHVHGHMHEPFSSNFSLGGSEERRYRQGPSLFGLETWGEDKKTRIHGYTAGQFEVTEGILVERIWPRRLVKKMGGHWRLDPDLSYDLDESNCIVSSVDLKNSTKEDSLINKTESSEKTEDNEKNNREQSHSVEDNENFGVDVSLLGDELNEEKAIKKLSNIPRLKVKADPQHFHIRQAERAHLEAFLLKDHCAWLLYDWGLAKDSFIDSSIERLDQDGNIEVFCLKCDEINNFEELESQFVKQFGLTLQEFCTYTSQLQKSIFIIDEIPPELIQNETDSREIFDRIIRSILDFSPNMFLVLSSRQYEVESKYGVVKLTPLEISDVANYISNHPKAGSELNKVPAIEGLFMRSEGLPMHLDRLIDTLQVASFKDLTDIELDIPIDSVASSEPIPKALKHAVASLSQSTDRYTRRSFKMLKVLSVLPDGETLQAIRRVYQPEPFFPQNAMELLDLSLLNVVAKERDNLEIKDNNVFDPLKRTGDDKTLCVPRQVRDYINLIITTEERLQIIFSLADLLFGQNWREGAVKIKRVKRLGVKGAMSTGPGNEHSVILLLLKNAIELQDQKTILQVLKLAISYCLELKSTNRYNDAHIATGDFISMLDENAYDEQYVELAIINGQSLRMIGQRDSALEVLETVIERDKNYLSNDRLSDVYLAIALIHESKRNTKNAVEAAQKIQTLESKNSAKYMQAESIILQFEDEPNRTNSLKLLERRARNKKHTTTANNIALDLARTSTNLKEKSKFLESILKESEDPYNRIRAAIDKVNMQSKDSQKINLKSRDLIILNFAYSYLFSQRMTTLFSKCHKAIWWILHLKSDVQKLLKIFRLSSFIWRIRGENDLEFEYLEDIENINLSEIRKLKDPRVQTDINYFERRLAKLKATNQ